MRRAALALQSLLLAVAVVGLAPPGAARAATGASPAASVRPAAASTTTPPAITRSGSILKLNGRPTTFVGVNAYELGTWWSVNRGCGAQVGDLNGFFSVLPRNALVRIWGFEALAVNKSTHLLDFTALDRVFTAAAAHHVRLLVTLANQSGVCDDGVWKGPTWYGGGYRTASGSALSPLSFWDYLHKVVARYRSSSALGMWELVNEPEPGSCAAGYAGNGCYGHATCPAAAAGILRGFFDKVGGELKRIDPAHLLAMGVIGANQCGVIGTDYPYVLASPALDVATVHDYGDPTAALTSLVSRRLSDATAERKPLLVEEAGVRAAPADCALTPALRAAYAQARMQASFASGVAGYLWWNLHPRAQSACGYDFGPNDPLVALLSKMP